MTQHGFFIDLSRCIGCNACVIACKQWHDIPPGPAKWLRIHQWETGDFPEINLNVLPVMCWHCEKPVCVSACPHGAIYKESQYGAVLVDQGKCHGERKCWKACPYGAPQFAGDGPALKMSKCNMCLDRLEKGNQPICVLSCSMRALEFGPMDEIRKKYGRPLQLDFLPRNSLTGPSVIFKVIDRKKQIIPWDVKKALALWQKRHPDNKSVLPDIFADISPLSHGPDDIIGRNKLVLKPKNSEELMYYTTDDE